MAADAEKAGDADKASQYTRPPRRSPVSSSRSRRTSRASRRWCSRAPRHPIRPRPPSHQNSRILQQKIAEKSKLLSQLEQAKMQEEMNSAMNQLNETVGDDVPTLKEVEEKIQVRYAKAKAASELSEASVESQGARGRAGHRQRRGAGQAVRAARRTRARRRRRPAAPGRGRRAGLTARAGRCPAVRPAGGVSGLSERSDPHRARQTCLVYAP